MADRLLMLLLYYRTYTTHARSSASSSASTTRPSAATSTRCSRSWPGSSPHPRAAGETGPRGHPRAVRRHRAPTRRPERGQREFYSGKKKRHTIKTQVVVVRRTKPPGPGAKSCAGRGSRRCANRSPARRMTRRCTTGRGWSPRARREADGRHGLHRDGDEDAHPAATRGRADRGPEVGEPEGGSSPGGGRARDRQDEGVADRGGAATATRSAGTRRSRRTWPARII